MMVLPVSVNDLEAIQDKLRAGSAAQEATVGAFFARASQLSGVWGGTAANSFYALCDDLHAVQTDLLERMQELCGPIIS